MTNKSSFEDVKEDIDYLFDTCTSYDDFHDQRDTCLEDHGWTLEEYKAENE